MDQVLWFFSGFLLLSAHDEPYSSDATIKLTDFAYWIKFANLSQEWLPMHAYGRYENENWQNEKLKDL